MKKEIGKKWIPIFNIIFDWHYCRSSIKLNPYNYLLYTPRHEPSHFFPFSSHPIFTFWHFILLCVNSKKRKKTKKSTLDILCYCIHFAAHKSLCQSTRIKREERQHIFEVLCRHISLLLPIRLPQKWIHRWDHFCVDHLDSTLAIATILEGFAIIRRFTQHPADVAIAYKEQRRDPHGGCNSLDCN